jgi:hypothetical protein
MGEYWDFMGRYDAETQAFSAFTAITGASVAGQYTPKKSGTLIGIRVIVGSQAATSLTEGVLIKMTCTKWTPNAQVLAVQGSGLRTAPGAQPPTFDFSLNQPVSESSPITLEGMCLEATHVTNSVLVIGKFI